MLCVYYYSIAGLKSYDRAIYNKFDLLFNDHSKQDIVVLGSSRTYYGVNSFLLEKLTKKQVVNLGLEGAKIKEMALAFNGYLNAHPKPEKVYLMLDPHSFSSDSLIYNKIYFSNYLNNDSVYCALKSNLGYKAALWKWLPYTIISEFDDYTRIKSMKGLFFKNADEKLAYNYKGFSSLKKKYAATKYEIDVSKINIDICQKSLEEIINTCVNNGIELQIIQGPFLEAYYNQYHINYFYETLAKRVHIKFPSISFQNTPINYDSIGYFKDETHLNDLGATKYTYDLFTNFIEKK